MRKMIFARVAAVGFSAFAGVVFATQADGRMPLVGISEQRLHADFNSVENCYSEALARAGFASVVVPCTTNEAVLAEIIGRIDLLVLSGGADVSPKRYRAETSPKCSKVDLVRDEFEFRLIAAARRRRLPIVGVCRGCQILNVAFGGTLWQDLPSEFTNVVAEVKHRFGSYYRPADFPSAHAMNIVPGTRLAAAIGAADLAVNSHHHQAVKDLAPGFVVAARSPDGVIEAIEGTDYPAFGIQGHPEALVARAESSAAYDHARLLKLVRSFPVLAATQKLERVVFLGAHPDDLASEMGTALLMRGRYEVHVIDYTHGERGCGEANFTNGWTRATRTAEETRVCQAIGAKLHWLEEVDGEAFAGRQATETLARLLGEIRPRAVILHWPMDVHNDHVMSFAAGMKALALAGLKPEVYYHFQESQARGFSPFVSVDVTSVLEEKNRIIGFYECQMGEKIAERKTKAQWLSGRAFHGSKGVYCEVYGVMPGTVRPDRCIFAALPKTNF